MLNLLAETDTKIKVIKKRNGWGEKTTKPSGRRGAHKQAAREHSIT